MLPVISGLRQLHIKRISRAQHAPAASFALRRVLWSKQTVTYVPRALTPRAMAQPGALSVPLESIILCLAPKTLLIVLTVTLESLPLPLGRHVSTVLAANTMNSKVEIRCTTVCPVVQVVLETLVPPHLHRAAKPGHCATVTRATGAIFPAQMLRARLAWLASF